MATHSSSQQAAALCRVEVCSGNVEQLSQLGQRSDFLHVTLTSETVYATKKPLVANVHGIGCGMPQVYYN